MAFADPREEVVFYVPLWIRSGITLDQFDNYWRDVHGPVCARLPGQMEYWQYHLSPYTGGIFPEIKNININTMTFLKLPCESKSYDYVYVQILLSKSNRFSDFKNYHRLY